MEDEKYIQEKELTGFPKAISFEVFDILKPKVKSNVCKIYCSDGSHGTGFFCILQYDWSFLKVFMTNNHVLSKEDISIGKTIKFSLNNDLIFHEIILDESRKIYSNQKYDITIIEIKQCDKLDEISFFDVDNRIFQENSIEIFKKKEIYLLHYPKAKQIQYSIGLIKNINEDNYTIQHVWDSSNGSSGAPIINSNDFKVIGIHKGGAQGSKNYNLGTFLKGPLEEFKNKIDIGNNNINNINENNNINNINENNNIQNEYLKVNEINENNQKNELINEDIDELIIQYKIVNLENDKYSKDIKLFGNKFVENNKDKCKLIIKGNEFELSSHFNINKKLLENNIFEVKLKGIKQITDISHMFEGDSSDPFDPDLTRLAAFPNISKWNTKNITNMSYMFFNYSHRTDFDDFQMNIKKILFKKEVFNPYSLKITLPDISNWDTQNVTDMSYMFSECTLLLSLPDISKWNTQKVTNMSYMFNGCLNLSSLPDISKWNTQNVININNMFSNCKSLSSLPDISKWNTQNINETICLFQNCSSLSCLPDLSKWNTQNVTNMSYMFSNCSLLLSIPDISKWETQNVCGIKSIFSNCSSLAILPDLSKWKTRNIISMSAAFSCCSSLSFLPDISKWNTQNVNNMSYMFNNCSSLSILPDLSKWNTQNVLDFSYMFYNCSSLTNLPDISKWNTQNAFYMSCMFSKCKLLSSLPDISQWNIKNVIYMGDNHNFNQGMFSDCSSLSSLPDISRWDISNVLNMVCMFQNCSSLSSLPDLSKWKNHYCYKGNMFQGTKFETLLGEREETKKEDEEEDNLEKSQKEDNKESKKSKSNHNRCVMF